MTTSQDLLKMISTTTEQNEEDEDTSNYKYVIYARKSTDDKEKQIRSLGDQIKECREFAKRNGIKFISKEITESESAKEPKIRPEFQKMMDDIERGKYDGILAWHPDRLARNMKDAGHIMDLLDKKVLKDLQFVTFTFQNNTMGKMLLGMAFVLSKQYSDALSDNVKRGTRRSIQEGKWLNKAKHGYYKDRNQMLRPDGKYFNMIEQAFKMRLVDTNLDEIANYLNKNDYGCPPSSKSHSEVRDTFKMTKQVIHRILKDPFYTGVLKYGETTVNLEEIYDFTPAVSVDDFLKMNDYSDIEKALKSSKRIYKENVIKADLMRGMIICGECNENMTAGITPKKNKNGTKNYFYYRCDNKQCKVYGKSLRAKIIIDYICKYLENHKFTSPLAYKHYSDEIKKVAKEKEGSLTREIASKNERKIHRQNLFNEIKKKLVKEQDPEIEMLYKEDVKDLEKEIEGLGGEILSLKEQKEKNSQVILTFAEYLELFDNLAERIQKIGVMEELDFIIKKIFLNFTIKEGKVALYTLNSPFGEFVNETKVSSCRGDRT